MIRVCKVKEKCKPGQARQVSTSQSRVVPQAVFMIGCRRFFLSLQYGLRVCAACGVADVFRLSHEVVEIERT